MLEALGMLGTVVIGLIIIVGGVMIFIFTCEGVGMLVTGDDKALRGFAGFIIILGAGAAVALAYSVGRFTIAMVGG